MMQWLAADELEPEELEKIGLSSWHDELSKEDFSLDAIAVFGKLSLLHEPLIIVFDQLEILGLDHNRSILLNFGEAVKEIFTRVPHSLIIFKLRELLLNCSISLSTMFTIRITILIWIQNSSLQLG
jgi:hypothetical protein